jgi:hypothetical protein
VTLVLLYPIFVRYVCKVDSWAHILWAFGLALKPGVTSGYILFVPRWIEYLEQCASTTRWFLNNRTPSASSQKHFTSPNSNLLRMQPIPTSLFQATMTSFLIVGMRAILFNAPHGMIRRFSSSRSPPGVRGWTTIWWQRSFRLRASAITFAFPGW